MKQFFFIISLLFSGYSWADDKYTSPPDLSLISMIASLLLVLACIFIFSFLMKKTNLLQNAKSNASIKIISTLPLSNKGRVQVVEVNDKRYLLGVTEQNINLLDTFDIPEGEASKTLPENNATPFATLLSKISAKQNE